MTFRIMTFSIMTFSIMTFSIMTFSIMTFSIMTFSIMSFSIMTRIMGLKVTLSINDTQHVILINVILGVEFILLC